MTGFSLHTGSNDMLEVHKGQANILPSRCLYTHKLINAQAETVKTKNAGLIFGLISDLNAVFPLEKDFWG